MRLKESSIDPIIKEEMGAKLRNFRMKLGIAIRGNVTSEKSKNYSVKIDVDTQRGPRQVKKK